MSRPDHDTTDHEMTHPQLAALHEVSCQLGAELELPALLVQIMDRAIELLDADQGVLMLAEDPGQVASVCVARKRGGAEPCATPAMSHSVIRRVLATGESMLLRMPVGGVAETTRSISVLGLCSILCVPLRAKGELFGVLYLDTARRDRAFGHGDRRFVEAFAGLSGAAIANAKAYRQIERLNGALEQTVSERTRELREANAELNKACEQLRCAQTRLVRTEKMASLARLVAGVAHEVNNPLGALSGNTQTARLAIEKLEQALESHAAPRVQQALSVLRRLLDGSEQACARIADVVAELGRFARLDQSEHDVVDLHEGIGQSLSLSEHLRRGRITVTTDFGQLPRLPCRSGELNQVFMSLLVNAFQAINGEGQVHVQTRERHGQLEISISDSGVGIEADDLGRVFDPGFTTRGNGVGTGLGLSIAHQVVEEHGGRIEVQSRPGAGSTFTILLPCAADRAQYAA